MNRPVNESDDSNQGSLEPGARWRLLARREQSDLAIEDNGIFDELVLDGWFHLERIQERLWWMRVGDARLLVTIDEDGGAKLTVERGFYNTD